MRYPVLIPWQAATGIGTLVWCSMRPVRNEIGDTDSDLVPAYGKG